MKKKGSRVTREPFQIGNKISFLTAKNRETVVRSEKADKNRRFFPTDYRLPTTIHLFFAVKFLIARVVHQSGVRRVLPHRSDAVFHGGGGRIHFAAP